MWLRPGEAAVPIARDTGISNNIAKYSPLPLINVPFVWNHVVLLVLENVVDEKADHCEGVCDFWVDDLGHRNPARDTKC
eukprot:COSAG01_NODE_4023_length_5426_cov_7.423503_6_plen_78_part_01